MTASGTSLQEAPRRTFARFVTALEDFPAGDGTRPRNLDVAPVWQT